MTFRISSARMLAAAALLAALAAVPASAQAPDRLARARAALPRPAAARLDELLQNARAKGLPTEALIDKTLEGLAKQAPPDRIMAVVAQLEANLDRARGLLAEGGRPSAEDITAAADALRRGVSENAVRTLRHDQPNQPVALAIVTLADLVQQGVPVDHALSVLQAWAQRGGKPSELRDLPAAIEHLMREGVLPAQAADAVARSLDTPGAARSATAGKANLAPGHAGKPDRPPVAPGAGPPPGKGKPPTTPHGR